MYLSIPGGNAEIIDSHPQATNGSQQHSCSTTQGITHTESSGWSMGFSLGFNGGKSNGGLVGTGSLGFSASWSHSSSTATSFLTTTGTSYSVNDLSVVKNTIIEDETEKVEWEYKFAEACNGEDMGYEQGSWWAAPLAITDCAQQNSMFYKVTNPSRYNRRFEQQSQ